MSATTHGTVGPVPDEGAGFPLVVTVKGHVGEHARERATTRLGHLARLGHTVERGRVVLTRREGPGTEPAMAEASLEVLDHRRHRHTVHAEVRAEGMSEAIDLLEQKLRNALSHLQRDTRHS